MKAKWGALIVDGRGKLGGHVASKNRAGSYLRTKVTPSNPQTIFQQGARNLLTSFSQGWRALSDTQRAAWNAAVQAFGRTNVFGDLVKPSGKNLFTRLNVNLSNAGQSTITDPPQPEGAGEVTAGTAVATNGGAYSIAHTGSTVGHTVQVWATPGVSPGRKYVRQEFRLLGTFAGGAASPYVATGTYTGRFGEAAVGTRVAFRLVSVNNTTGENSVPSESDTITV